MACLKSFVEKRLTKITFWPITMVSLTPSLSYCKCFLFSLGFFVTENAGWAHEMRKYLKIKTGPWIFIL